MLVVEGLSVTDDRGLPAVRDVSFEVREGEIVGIAGVDGNGQSELIDALAGLRKPDSGRVLVGGEDVTSESVRQHLDDGIGHIPEDRQRRGLVLEFTLAENLAFFAYRQPPVSRFGWLRPRRMIERAKGPADRLRRARRRTADARSRALGREPAEGRARARGRA